MFQLLLAIIYLAFISLGLPDALLGSAWPTMYQELSVPVSFAGGISMIIAAGTIISSLQSDRLTRRFGTRKSDSFQCTYDGSGVVRVFCQPFLCGAVSVGQQLSGAAPGPFRGCSRRYSG